MKIKKKYFLSNELNTERRTREKADRYVLCDDYGDTAKNLNQRYSNGNWKQKFQMKQNMHK